MRISDWSSDVCSSDLSGLARHEQADVVVELIGGSDGPALTLARETLKQGRHFVTANKAMIAHHGLEQIGRASCRERVCQYVSIPVDAVSFKTTNNRLYNTNHYINYIHQ